MSTYSSVRSTRKAEGTALKEEEEKKKYNRKPIGQQKSIQNSINRMIKGRIVILYKNYRIKGKGTIQSRILLMYQIVLQ